MFKQGIIDPTKEQIYFLILQVVKTALQDAASVASLMITTESMVVEIKEENTT